MRTLILCLVLTVALAGCKTLQTAQDNPEATSTFIPAIIDDATDAGLPAWLVPAIIGAISGAAGVQPATKAVKAVANTPLSKAWTKN